MKNILLLFINVLFFLLFSQCCREDFEIVLRNGMIYDGSISAPFRADIGIKDGIIEKIGKKIPDGKAVVIDASNLVVAPGFIDIHTHCDGQILKEGMNSTKNYLTQGVTTVVTGNCGSGTFEVGKFFDKLDSISIGTNIVHLVGHNVIRGKVMGMDDRNPTQAELEEMKRLVAIGMEGGAAGMSTGLFYTPGAYSSANEVVELAKVVKNFGGFYASHIRDESNYSVGLEEAVREAIYIGEQTGIRVEISHLKALGKPVWGLSNKICKLIEEARNKGIQVFADQYPYNASNTILSAAVVSPWVAGAGRLKERLTDPELLPRIKKEAAENIERRGGPESLLIVSYPNDQRFNGKNIQEISQIINKTPVETAIQLVLEGNPSVISFNMKESDVINFMTKEYVMTCSDGDIVVPGSSAVHPRCYGAFPKKIKKYVLEKKIISMEQAINAATMLPAKMIGLKNRGNIVEGNVADIVLFNPQEIKDKATYEDSHQYSQGIEYVLVNGEIVIEKGQYNGKLAGKTLRIRN